MGKKNNPAKLREALVEIAKICKEAIEGGESLIEGCDPAFYQIDKIAKAALAAPPRNLDMYDHWQDAADAWPEQEMCAGRRFQNGSCDGCRYSPVRCVTRWLFALAQESEAAQ